MKSPKERAKELVAQMTLAEKCAQMKYDAPAIERLWGACLQLVERGPPRGGALWGGHGVPPGHWHGGQL